MDDKYKLPVKKDLKRKFEAKSSQSNEDVSKSKKERKIKPESSKTNNESLLQNNTLNKKQKSDENISDQLQLKIETSNKNNGVEETVIIKTNEKLSSSQKEEKRNLPNTQISIKKDSSSKKNKLLSRMKTAQSSNQPIEFDYSKVDFKKFQGGAEKSQPTEIKAKFFGKVGVFVHIF